ncbi:hypothetical protein ElyMa_001962800, partial [Elysia marginata]
IDIMSASPSAALLQRGSSTSRRDLSISSLARFYYEDDEIRNQNFLKKLQFQPLLSS